MSDDYKNALRAGQKEYRTRIARGQSPCLAVLDDILVNVKIAGQEPLGLLDIPLENVVGTKTSGRHTAFASNFMPLLGEKTEFADKWSHLCEAHLAEGIHTPIQAFEFLNRFYVIEGNKRVSVLRYFDAVTIPANVIRIIPAPNDSTVNRIYYEFLDFYRLSHVNTVDFTRLGSYAKLQQAVCKAAAEPWTDEDRQNFSAFFTIFRKQFEALGGNLLPLTPGDALLVYLSVYRYADACDSTPAQIRENLQNIWEEITVLTRPQAVELSLEPESLPDLPLLSRLSSFLPGAEDLNVVFLNEHNAEDSAWVRSHDLGRAALESAYPERLRVSCQYDLDPAVDAEQIIEQVVQQGADVVFTTSVGLLPACLRVAARHPQAKILNCSLNVPHPTVRTYYPRSYEAAYFMGLLAGILSPTDTVGYTAAFPIYGVPAAINAFAQGLRAVRPSGKVLLRWGCLPQAGQPLDFRDRPDVTLFFARDSREPENVNRDYGLCRRAPDGSLETLAVSLLHWEIIYKAIIRSVLNGAWDTIASGAAINYWWGIRSGAVELRYSQAIPAGTLQILDLVEKQLQDGALRIFPQSLYDQRRTLHTPQSIVYTPEELLQMDWLDECVEGSLPAYEALDLRAQRIADIIGLDCIR